MEWAFYIPLILWWFSFSSFIFDFGSIGYMASGWGMGRFPIWHRLFLTLRMSWWHFFKSMFYFVWFMVNNTQCTARSPQESTHIPGGTSFLRDPLHTSAAYRRNCNSSVLCMEHRHGATVTHRTEFEKLVMALREPLLSWVAHALEPGGGPRLFPLIDIVVDIKDRKEHSRQSIRFTLVTKVSSTLHRYGGP